MGISIGGNETTECAEITCAHEAIFFVVGQSPMENDQQIVIASALCERHAQAEVTWLSLNGYTVTMESL